MRGIVTRATPDGGIAERATEVRQLLEDDGVPGAGQRPRSSGGAMEALWRLELAPARRGSTSTLAAFPAHTLAPQERSAAQELATRALRLRAEDRRQGVLLAVGVLALLAAAACALALAWGSLGRSRPAAGGR